MKWTIGGLVVVIAALAIALGVKSCAPAPDVKIPPALQKTIDSLKATAAPHAQTRDSIIRIVIHDTVRAAGASSRGDTSAAAAARSQIRADSLAALARVSADSAALWRDAFDAQKETTDSLRSAFVSKDSAYRSERDARVRLLGVMHTDSVRTRVIEDAQARLVKRIGELETACRIIGPIKCPSRTATMITTAIAIVAIDAKTRK